MAVQWLKTGKESAAAAKQEEAAAKQRKEEQGKMWRFFMKQDEEDVRITFVDGDLSDEGYLMPPRFYEHNVQMNGKYGNLFVCPEKTDPASGEKCPLCEQGDPASLVALFTIIDHRPFTRKDGSIGQDTPKILAAKPITFQLLNTLAVKRKGLAGCTFDVMRTGDKSAAVGSMFDFVEKHNITPEFKAQFVREYKDAKTGKTVTVQGFEPANYEAEIVYRTADELRTQYGFGKGLTSGSSPMGSKPSPAGTKPDYEQHL